MKRNKSYFIYGLILAIVFTIGLFGCDTREPDTGDSTGPSLSPTVRKVGSIVVDSPSASPYEMVTNGVSTVSLVVRVKNTENVPLDSVSVYFSSERGQVTVTQRDTDENGQAIAELQNKDANDTVVFGEIVVNISAGEGDNRVERSFTVIFKQEKPTSFRDVASIVVDEPVSNPHQVIADGVQTVYLKARVRNKENVPLDSVEVSFRCDQGQLVVTQSLTDANGHATAELQNKAANDEVFYGEVTITIEADSVRRDFRVIFAPNEPTPVSSIVVDQPTTNPYHIVTNVVSTVNIQVRLRDENNVPIEGTPVSFTASQGQLTITQQMSDSDGYATAELENKEPDNTIIFGEVVVTVSAGGLARDFRVIFDRDLPRITLSSYNSNGDEAFQMVVARSNGLELVAGVSNSNDGSLSDYPVSFLIDPASEYYQLSPTVPTEGYYLTDSQGEVRVNFTDSYTYETAPSSPQMIDVTAYLPDYPDIRRTIRLVLLPLPSGLQIGLTANPAVISAGDSEGIEIEASLRDSMGIAVADRNITFYIQNAEQQIGHLQYATVMTGNSGGDVGIARNYYFNDYTRENAPVSPVEVYVVAQYEATFQVVSVVVNPFPQYDLQVNADPLEIEAGVTASSEIECYVSRDGSDYANQYLNVFIPRIPIDYTYNGQVYLLEGGGFTGEDGILKRYVTERFNPVPTQNRLVEVVVKNDTIGVRESIWVTITPPSFEFDVDAIPEELPVGANQTVTIRAGLSRNGELIPNIPLQMRIPPQYRYDNQVRLQSGPSTTGTNGILERTLEENFNPPPEESLPVLVEVRNDSLHVRDSVWVTIVPPNEFYTLSVETDRPLQNADGYGDYCTITATLMDELDMPIEGERISFSFTTTNPDVGDIPSAALTDTLGRALVRFHDGYEEEDPLPEEAYTRVYGTWEAGNLVDSTAVITVQPWVQEPRSLTVQFSTPRIQVANTGGLEECIVTITVFDELGDPVPYADVDFILTGPSGGENLDGIGTELTKVTNVEGVATVSILSGIRPGTLTLQVRAGEMNWQTYRNVTIASGPPNSIMVGYDLTNMEALGGVYQMVCSAVVKDVYRNPVEDSTVVYWTVDPDEAQIDAYTWTANTLPPPGMSGQGAGPITGTAYTYIRATSSLAYLPITLIAVCDSVVGTQTVNFDISVPGFLYIEVIPLVQFVELPPPPEGEDTCEEIPVIVRVTDEFGTPMAGIVVLVTTLECGQITGDNPVITDGTGQAQTIFQVCYSGFDTPGTYGCEVNAYQYDPLHPEINGSATIQVRVLNE